MQNNNRAISSSIKDASAVFNGDNDANYLGQGQDVARSSWPTTSDGAPVEYGQPGAGRGRRQQSDAVLKEALRWHYSPPPPSLDIASTSNLHWNPIESSVPSSISGLASSPQTIDVLAGGNATTEAKRPPRPPNAWILYRSDCIQHEIANRAEGAPKPTQAELSKQFGEQWRREPEVVKAEYERMAETAREEHAQKYPDWRFARRMPKHPSPSSILVPEGLEPATPQALSPPKTTKSRKLRGEEQVSKRLRMVSADSVRIFSPNITWPAQDLQSSWSSPHNGAPETSFLADRASLANNHYQTLNFGRDNASPSSTAVSYVFPDRVAIQNSPNYATSFGEMQQARIGRGGPDQTLARRTSAGTPLSRAQAESLDGLEFQTVFPGDNRMATASRTPQFASTSPVDPVSDRSSGRREHFHRPYGGSGIFGEQALSLPNMPFGVGLTMHGMPAGTAEAHSPGWLETVSPSAGDFQMSFSQGPSVRSLANLHSTTIPPWLYALRDVRVRQDDISGIPLLAFLQQLRMPHTPMADNQGVWDHSLQPSDTQSQYSFP